jgi:hypothetical protein
VIYLARRPRPVRVTQGQDVVTYPGPWGPPG